MLFVKYILFVFGLLSIVATAGPVPGGPFIVDGGRKAPATVQPDDSNAGSGQGHVEQGGQQLGPGMYNPNMHAYQSGPGMYNPNMQAYQSGPGMYDPNMHAHQSGPGMYNPYMHAYQPGPEMYDPNMQLSGHAMHDPNMHAYQSGPGMHNHGMPGTINQPVHVPGHPFNVHDQLNRVFVPGAIYIMDTPHTSPFPVMCLGDVPSDSTKIRILNVFSKKSFRGDQSQMILPTPYFPGGAVLTYVRVHYGKHHMFRSSIENYLVGREVKEIDKANTRVHYLEMRYGGFSLFEQNTGIS